MIYFWTEDRKDKSGYQFWETFLNILYSQVVLESKTNSSELVKSVSKINSDDTYIVALDHSFDNDQSIREVSTLKKVIQTKNNVYELNLISFEFVLLSFSLLLDWIYAEQDEFREKRGYLISVREKLLEAVGKQNDYKEIPEIVEWINKIDEYNIEQITAKLLYELTRNTGFVVDKSNLGVCWKVDCCGYDERGNGEVCGLDISRLSLVEKMQAVMNESLLKKEFKRIGLEAVL
ncbi:MAG: hypothetical protein NC393_00745 [Clostridium sp.]|nr:hypothetical protein [Clostridium sp.]MCM1209318.1 hypothetical protein [Ruminococcus sp.]